MSSFRNSEGFFLRWSASWLDFPPPALTCCTEALTVIPSSSLTNRIRAAQSHLLTWEEQVSPATPRQDRPEPPRNIHPRRSHSTCWMDRWMAVRRECWWVEKEEIQTLLLWRNGHKVLDGPVDVGGPAAARVHLHGVRFVWCYAVIVITGNPCLLF